MKPQDGQGHSGTIALFCKERRTSVHYIQCSFYSRISARTPTKQYLFFFFFACYLSELWRILKSKKLLSKLG